MDSNIIDYLNKLQEDESCNGPRDAEVDISNTNRMILLKALWDNSSPALFFTKSGITPPEWEEPESAYDYFDYYMGRVIKMYLGVSTVLTYQYDIQECTTLTAKEVIDSVRSKS